MKLFYALAIAALAVVGCDKQPQSSTTGSTTAQCHKDTDCKGDRICEAGVCTSPQSAANLTGAKPEPAIHAPAAPSMAYTPMAISDDQVGGVFTLDTREMGGAAINYVSRAGVVNVMEFVVDDVDLTTYVGVEKAYSFGGKYLLVVSTGESGMSCPATTYAFTYDSASESVTGKTEIDGCSENVEALAEGNKLTVKKEGKASVFYNGDVK